MGMIDNQSILYFDDQCMGLMDTTISPELLGGPVDEVGLDILYDMLRNHRRRMVLFYLSNAPEGKTSIGPLAEQLAAWENEIPVAAVNSKLRKRTYNTLQQHHLPKLDDTGIIEYDRARGRVELVSDPRQLKLFLNVLPRTKSSWITGFLVLGTIFWLALLVNWVGVHLLDVFPAGSASALFGLSFVVIFGTHGYVLYRFLQPKKKLA